MSGAPTDVYIGLRAFMRNYASGDLPAAIRFLALPGKVPNWLELLLLTEPMEWSIRALHAVTVAFVQSSPPRKLQKYHTEVLLSYVLKILDSDERANERIFETIAFATRKPQPFISGFLLPLFSENVQSGRETKFLSMVITRVGLPTEHANAFIIKISECEGVAASIALQSMIWKGYQLTVAAIDAIVAYFMRTGMEEQPLVWHKALLEFVSKYGVDTTEEQKVVLEDVARRHKREGLTDAIVEKLGHGEKVEK